MSFYAIEVHNNKLVNKIKFLFLKRYLKEIFALGVVYM